ncbi:related to RDS2 - Regulator of drug sensitivity [Melanopsichium pennsylvanicum]|uniref:Related to RDS2 - Regulator of drug sensitivity n=2 Tax=Melanopsichium pennsylvanicum TaxID=63383 RepID=A0AAJ4XR72_9BASI|nr:related to RDS2-Regulator of drug sensitivity [Melanopsichium pennsylvanicum 4]SNX86426.1 related to RDS2 - Regulator of drug sensitivity [Melanopsichium pennsylvanicum]
MPLHRSSHDPRWASRGAVEQRGRVTEAAMRETAMRETRIASSSDHRLPSMQPSGLPQGHMDAESNYVKAHHYHNKPVIPSRASYDHPRSTQPYERDSVPAERLTPVHAPLLPSRSHSERTYDSYDAAGNDPRNFPQYYEGHSPRHLAHYEGHSPRHLARAPYHSQRYADSPRALHQQQQQQPQSQERPLLRQHLPHADHQGWLQTDPYAYPRRDLRADDRSSAHARATVLSPPYFHRPTGRISPSNDVAAREAYLDHVHSGPTPESTSAPYDRRPMPSTRNNSYTSFRDPASSSSNNEAASSGPPRSTPASRKRKKQFKYMLEQDGAGPSKAPNAGAEDDQETDRADTLDAAESPNNAAQRKESRKKVKKACIFCKRSHMPCEEARPCKRCVKRGISHLCRDAEPGSLAGTASTSSGSRSTSTNTKSKFEDARKQARTMRRRSDNDNAAETESGSDTESMTSSAASSVRQRGSETGSLPSSRLNEMPGAAARDPECSPAMLISGLLSQENVDLARRPPRRPSSPTVSAKKQEEAWNRSMDLPTQHKMTEMLKAGPAAADLSDIFGEHPTSLLMTPETANLPLGQSILRPCSAELPTSPGHADRSKREKFLKRSRSMNLITEQCEVDEAGFKLPARPKHLLQEEMATTSELRGGPRSYSYTYGYAKLARWMHTRFSRASCEEVDRSLSIVRPKFMALSRSLAEEELISVEDNFYQLLAFYQANVLETIPVPIIITRRTGEIYAANSHACKLFNLPESLFEGGQICHYQLVTEHDCVKMWGTYAQEAQAKLDMPPSHKVTLEVDRSLLLFDKPSFDPRTGELLGDGLCEDGTEAVLRREVIITFEAKISKHGLPFMVTGCIIPIPDDESD